MSEFEQLSDIQTRLATWRKKLEAMPDDPDIQRTVQNMEDDRDRLERKLFPEKYLPAPEAVVETEPETEAVAEETAEETIEGPAEEEGTVVEVEGEEVKSKKSRK